ncbi:MAG: SgcJ/EcaC family oxidoreductase [Roseiflexaceae bacterium]
MSTQSSHPQAAQSRDTTDIGALYQQLLEGWNQRDAAAYAALFAEDASVVGFDGSQMNGRAEIATQIGQIFADHPTSRYVGKIREVRLLAADAAILRAVVGMVPPGESDLKPDVNAIQSLVAARHAGQWLIALFQNTPARFDGRPELAQQLTDELRELL